MTLEAQTTATALPGGRLLNYVGSVNTPTRAKRVAGTATLAVGIAYLAAAVLMLGAFGWEVRRLAVDVARWAGIIWHGDAGVGPPAPSPDFGNYVEGFNAALRHEPEMFVLGVVGGFCGLLLVVFCRAVKRGQRVPAYISIASLFPLMLMAGSASAGFGAGFLMFALGLFHEPRSWWALPCFLGLAACGLIVLLLKDLCGFLRWIGKQPSAEKPAAAFLPVKKASAST